MVHKQPHPNSSILLLLLPSLNSPFPHLHPHPSLLLLQSLSPPLHPLRFTTPYLTLDALSLHFIPSSPSNCILHAHHQLPERDETTTRYDTISAAPLYCAYYCISSARLCTTLHCTTVPSIFLEDDHPLYICPSCPSLAILQRQASPAQNRHYECRYSTFSDTRHPRLSTPLSTLSSRLLLVLQGAYTGYHGRSLPADHLRQYLQGYRGYRDICCSPLTTTA